MNDVAETVEFFDCPGCGQRTWLRGNGTIVYHRVIGPRGGARKCPMAGQVPPFSAEDKK